MTIRTTGTSVVRSALLALLGAAALILPAPAPAAPPTLQTTLIVPGKSAGGVSLGMTVKQARAAWGRGGYCLPARLPHWCSWRGAATEAGIDFSLRKGRINGFTLVAGTDGTNPLFGGSAGTLRTRPGVGIGSTEADLIAAYPAIAGGPSPLGQGVQYLLTSGAGQTTFIVDRRLRVVTSIAIGAG